MNALTSSITSSRAANSEWWRGAVIYQIYPRSFLDSNDDGIGDLNGILSKLDYLSELGVDGVWISPFYTSPMKDFGYDVADYCDVDPIFGNLSDFDNLIEKAHSLDLKVIIDQVFSHTSEEHAWFAESRLSKNNPKSDWYVWENAKPDGSPPSNWQSVFGGPAWTWDARRKQYYLHNFLKEQPQLNVHNPEVQNALLAASKFWLDRGVDGFRLDAINFSMHNRELTDNPMSNTPECDITRPFDMQLHIHNQSQPEIPAFLERVRSLLDEYGATFSVAEVGGPDPMDEMLAFTANGKRLNSAYNFDFLYAKSLSPKIVADSISAWTQSENEGWPSWAFSNHDAPRATSRWFDVEAFPHASQTIMMLLLSIRGNPIIYQGEELGLEQGDVPFDRLTDPEAITNWPLTLGRDGVRTPMPWHRDLPNAGFSNHEPWLPVDPRHYNKSVEIQSTQNNSCLNSAKSLLQLRKGLPPLIDGKLELVSVEDQLLVFKRRSADRDVYCCFNLSSTPATLQLDAPVTLLANEMGAIDVNQTPDKIMKPWSGMWAATKET